ncbi:MAG: IS1/IS1595 family N-terminal zinc-binding domain-containing protein [Microcoleus sp.]
MKCNKCGAPKVWGHGTQAGRRRWRCPECGHTQTEGSRADSAPPCPRCGSVRTKFDGLYREGVRAVRCKDCKKRSPVDVIFG